MDLKKAVQSHWETEPCGTHEIAATERRTYFAEIERFRYELEPYIRDYARFESGRDQRLLEVGIGVGTDFVNWVRNGARAVGIDLSHNGVVHTRERLQLEGLRADVMVADAENLPFTDESFDFVYSWGVIHHSPNTSRAVREIHRVLKPGGRALVMIYHVRSWLALILWLRRCLFTLRPWHTPRWAVYHFCESPGTKAYTRKEAEEMFKPFRSVEVRTQLTWGDLLWVSPKARHPWYFRLAAKLFPRWLVAHTGNRFGFYMPIEAVK